MMGSPWIVPIRTCASPRLALYAFHYAGGSAGVFTSWARKIPADVEIHAIQMPGRWERIRDPFVLDLHLAVDAIFPAVLATRRRNDCPYGLVGYSMGAFLAFELARKLRAAGERMPERLFVLSRNAPHFRSFIPEIHRLPENAFIDALQSRYGGIAPGVLADPELRQVFLPILRADFTLLETYRFHASEPLNLPISAWRGSGDSVITEEGTRLWSELTCAGFEYQDFEGGHFFAENASDSFFGKLSHFPGAAGI